MEFDRIGANWRGLKGWSDAGIGKQGFHGSIVRQTTAKQQRTGFDGLSYVCTRRCNDRARGKGEMVRE